MIVENNSLGDFNGWDNSSDVDFFKQLDDEESGNTDVKDVIEKLTKEDGEDSKVLEEADMFAEAEENFSEEEETEEEKENKDLQSTNIFVLNKLKEKGYLDYELEEGEELTEELAEELLENSFDESVDNKVKELMNGLPDDGKQMIQYLVKGGNLGDFINTLSSYNSSIDFSIDLEKEDNQISTMKKLLKLEEKDDEEIETEIEFLKDSGRLKSMTEKKFNKYKIEVENKKADILIKQEETIENEKKLLKEAKVKISTFLNDNQEIDGVKFSKDDKKELPSYMNDKSIKLQNGNTITQMQKELFYDLPKNEKALIQLAALLKNRNQDGTFNFSSIMNTAKTKVTQEVKQEIRRNNTSIPGSSINKKNNSEKGLSDYFD